jgi:hypothetical protein
MGLRTLPQNGKEGSQRGEQIESGSANRNPSPILESGIAPVRVHARIKDAKSRHNVDKVDYHCAKMGMNAPKRSREARPSQHNCNQRFSNQSLRSIPAKM